MMAGDDDKNVITNDRDASRSPHGKPAEGAPMADLSIEVEAGSPQAHHPPQSGAPSAADHLATNVAQLALLPAITYVGQAQLASDLPSLVGT